MPIDPTAEEEPGDEPAPPTSPQAAPRGANAWDAELLTMHRMLRQLEDLEETARGRVIAYLVNRYPLQP